jgi:galactoside 2-L-fucosyltransferase 1/2
MPHCITSKKKKLFLTLLLLTLVFITIARYWPKDFYHQQAIPHKLSPSPQIAMLDYESSLCLKLNTHIKPQLHNIIRCPQNPIVTVEQLGRLGNQMYEYISVWAAAKKTGREPYVPSCMIRKLEKIFRNLPVHPLSYLAYCPVEERPVPVTADKLEHFNGSIILPKHVQLLTYIALLLDEVRQIFSLRNM